MEEPSQDQVNPPTTEPESTARKVPRWRQKRNPQGPGRRRKGFASNCKDRPIAKQPYRGVIISVQVSVCAADESLLTALVKLSMESTVIALLELSQGFATNEAAEAFGIELGKRWIEERR